MFCFVLFMCAVGRSSSCLVSVYADGDVLGVVVFVLCCSSL